MMFFALSGYLVGGSALRALGKRRWSWGNYLLNRATRLYVALIPALILTAILDHLARTHGGMNMGYAPQSMKDFWGSVFFLQGISTQPYGSDGPLWSLSYEFWFYILFSVDSPLGKTGIPSAPPRHRTSHCGCILRPRVNSLALPLLAAWRRSLPTGGSLIRTRPVPCAWLLWSRRWS